MLDMEQSIICHRHDQNRLPGDSTKDVLVHDACSWCGSLNPFTLMDLIEKDKIMLMPTDKSYKVYVEANQGSGVTFDAGRSDEKDDKGEFLRRRSTGTKFYFQHLSTDQQMRFVTLLNGNKIKLGYPGYFYTLPFFIGE